MGSFLATAVKISLVRFAWASCRSIAALVPGCNSLLELVEIVARLVENRGDAFL